MIRFGRHCDYVKKIFVGVLLAALSISLVLCPQLQSSAAGTQAKASINQEVADKDPLITPAQLNALLKLERIKIIDVRPSERYQKEHLPGAVNTWWNDYGDSKGFVPTPERFAALLSSLGVANNDTVVLYADSDKHGPAYAAHFWWLLDMFGQRNVKIMDGGLEAWLAAGYPVTSGNVAVTASDYQINTMDQSKLATTEEVLAAVTEHDPAVIILDVREWGEFSGSFQAPGAVRKGRIPGAVWLYWGDTLNSDNTLKNVDELRKLFAEKGITPDKAVITYCQAGVRAAHTAFVLSELLGYKHVKNYAGSWVEWSQHSELPTEVDEP